MPRWEVSFRIGWVRAAHGQRRKKKKNAKLDRVEGQLLPDREVLSVLTTGALGPAASDAESLLGGLNAPKPIEPDGLYESGDNA